MNVYDWKLVLREQTNGTQPTSTDSTSKRRPMTKHSTGRRPRSRMGGRAVSGTCDYDDDWSRYLVDPEEVAA